MIVGHREGETVGEAFPHAQALHHGQGIVQDIGIVAVGIQAERAVAAGCIGLRRETDQIMDIRVHGRGQRAADRWRILGNNGRGSGHGGRVIAAVDAHGHDRGRRAAVVVRDCDHERVGQAFARAQALHRGQRGIQRIGIVAVGVHAERAVAARSIALGRKTDHIVHIRIRGHGQGAAGNGAVFGDVHGCGVQHRRIIAAVDGYGQRIGGRAAMPVGHREGECLVQAFANTQPLHHGKRIIKRVGVVAVGVHVERAVLTGDIGLGDECHCIMDIRVHGRGQRAADRWRILGNGGRGNGHGGRVVAAVDGHGQGVGGCGSVIVGHRERKGIGEAFAHPQALHCGQCIVQRVGIVAVGIHGKCAVQTGRVCLWNKTHDIMHVRVHGRGQRAADSGRIFNNGGCGRSHNGRVVAAVDAHGYDCGRRAAVIVGHCDGKAVGEAFASAQTLQCGQGRILHIGIIARGIHAECAVVARCIS